jgi:hypothetical protein
MTAASQDFIGGSFYILQRADDDELHPVVYARRKYMQIVKPDTISKIRKFWQLSGAVNVFIGSFMAPHSPFRLIAVH